MYLTGAKSEENAQKWLKSAAEFAAHRKRIFKLAGHIVCTFFRGLDTDQFISFREQDNRVDPRTIIEYLDPIQFLMPYQDSSEKKFENLTKSKFLEMINEILNFASENLRNYSKLMTD